jgi:hypothetical protein
MSVKIFDDGEKLKELERVIVRLRREVPRDRHCLEVLRAVADEYQGRKPERRTLALARLDERVASVKRAANDGASVGPLIGLGQEVMGVWPSVRRALTVWENGECK